MCKNKKSLSNRLPACSTPEQLSLFCLENNPSSSNAPRGCTVLCSEATKQQAPSSAGRGLCRHEALGQPSHLWGTQPCMPTLLTGSQPRHPAFLLCCISFQNILSDSKEPACQCRSIGIPGLGRSPGAEHGNPLQYSCLEHPMDRGAQRATVHRVARRHRTKQQQGSCHSGKSYISAS